MAATPRRVAPPAAAAPVEGTLPDPRRLFTGDRTTAGRFRAGLPLTPHAQRAELVRGIVRLNDSPPDPDRAVPRAALSLALQTAARQYEVETAGVVRAVGVRCTLSPRDELFLDAALYVPTDGRCAAVTDDDGTVRLVGPPAVALCVARPGADRYDLHDRHEALTLGGVSELVHVGPDGHDDRDQVRWYRLDGDPAKPTRDGGHLRSAALPGFWLPEGLVDAEPSAADLTAAVRAGCGTLDHALFVNALCAGRKPR